jgi:hypothetical protein
MSNWGTKTIVVEGEEWEAIVPLSPPTEDELRATIKAMLEGQEKAVAFAASVGAAFEMAIWNASIKPREWRVIRSIDATHNGRKRHPVEWPS